MRIALANIAAEQIAKRCVGAKMWDREEKEESEIKCTYRGLGPLYTNVWYGDGVSIYTLSMPAGDGCGMGKGEDVYLIDVLILDFVPGPLALSHPGY